MEKQLEDMTDSEFLVEASKVICVLSTRINEVFSSISSVVKLPDTEHVAKAMLHHSAAGALEGLGNLCNAMDMHPDNDGDGWMDPIFKEMHRRMDAYNNPE